METEYLSLYCHYKQESEIEVAMGTFHNLNWLIQKTTVNRFTGER